MQPWYFPSRQDCISCHTRAAGGVLGVKTRQSNLDHLFAETGVTDNQLRAWNHAGYFEPAINESGIGSMTRLAAVTNETASLEFRARSYLDSNCSHCHRPGGARAAWDARIETPLGMAGIVGGPVADTLGVPGSQVVVARDLSRSILYRRASTATEPYRMPPVGKNVVDKAGVDLLASWIQSLTPPPSVTITSPTSGSFYYGPLVLTLNANAISANGDIVKVEYYSGETKLGESTRAPYSFVWEASPGSYEIRAFATDVTGQTGQSAIVPFTVIGASSQGLLGEYFDNMNLTARRVVRFDPTVNFDWGNDSPDPLIGPDTFSVRWTGQIKPRFSQTYTFTVTADDGVRLWVNGRLIVDQWIDQSPTSHSGTIALQANQLYMIRMEMYENGGGAVAKLEWESPGQTRQIIPSSSLFPPSSTSSNPTIALASPLNGDVFRQPAVLDIVAIAADSDGTIARVEYFADGSRLGETLATPHRWHWTNAPVGVHSLYVSATDSQGLITSSASSNITIEPLELTLPARAIVDGRFHFAFAATTGQRYRIESSTNLVDWVLVETQTAENGGVEFSEPVGSAVQFYRSVPQP